MFIYNDSLQISRIDKNKFNVESLRAYQVSEKSDSLNVKGYSGGILIYNKWFQDLNRWEDVKVEFKNIDKIVFECKKDFNLDNLILN